MRNSDIFFNGGKFSSQGPWIHSTRSIDSYELILVTKGRVYLQEAGQQFELKPNDYILLHPQVIHGGYRTTEDPLEFYWLHFEPHDSRKFTAPYTGTLSSPSAMIQMARQLLQIRQSPAYPKETADHLLFVLLTELTVQREQQEPQNALAARVHEYVRAHAYHPISVSQVADAMGYHSDHLSRTLKTCYGVTLQQDITEQRLSYARSLLQTTENTVAAIALEMGYEDPNLFEKFFRYHQGVSPTAYRNSFSKMHTNHK